MDNREICVWYEDQDANWNTQCDSCFFVVDGTPIENGMNYCCYCGRRLEQILYMDSADEEQA